MLRQIEKWNIFLHNNAHTVRFHHMNPIRPTDIYHGTDFLMNPEYLICVCHNTHNAIHYGDESLLITEPIVRTPYDTCPWKR